MDIDNLKELLDMLISLTRENSLKFAKASIEFVERTNLVTCNEKNISDKQFKELSNMVEQFNKIFDSYIEEQNIKLEDKKDG